MKYKPHPAIEFFEALYPDGAVGFVNLRFITSQGQVKRNAFIGVHRIPEKLPPLLEKYRGCNAHFQLSLVNKQEGGKAHICQIWAIGYDIDFREGGLTEQEWLNLPPLPENLRVNILVRTGGGVHGYFLLKEPLGKEDISQIEGIARRLATWEKGDLQATEAGHLFRVPGTRNFKYDPPREVEVWGFKHEERYDPSAFDCLPPLKIPSSENEEHNPPGWEEGIFNVGVSEGKRNAALTKLAGKYVSKRLTREEALRLLLDANSRFKPPLDQREVEGVLDSVMKTHQRKHPEESSKKPDAMKLLDRIEERKLLRPAQDYVNGLLWYGVPAGKEVLLINSNREIIRGDDVPAGLTLDDQGFDLCQFTRAGIVRFLNGESVNGPNLVKALRAYFQNGLIVRDSRIYLLLTLWAIGTYLYQIFRVYPYLSFRSPTTRCGKSSALDLLSAVCFNVDHVETSPSVGFINRGPSQNGGVVLLDEIERLRGEHDEEYKAVKSTLNAGFEQGRYVTRLEKRGNKYVPVRYPAYCPRAFAGINKLWDELQTRTIIIFLEKKLRSQRLVERYKPVMTFKRMESVRDDLYIWALEHAEDVAQVYEQAEQFKELADLEDRERDLWEPLVTIAKLVGAEGIEGEFSPSDELCSLAYDLSEVRAGIDSTRVSQALGVLKVVLGEKKEVRATPNYLLSQFKESPYFEWMKTGKHLAEELAPLGFVSSTQRNIEDPDIGIHPTTTREVFRGYRITRERLEDLETKYTKEDE